MLFLVKRELGIVKHSDIMNLEKLKNYEEKIINLASTTNDSETCQYVTLKSKPIWVNRGR